MPDLNPYAPPLTTDPRPATCYGQLEMRFTMGNDDVMLPTIRASMPRDAAEHVGSFVCLVVLVPSGMLTIVLVQFTVFWLGVVLLWLEIIASAIAGFAAREFWMRRTARGYLNALRQRLEAMPEAPCRVQLTRTKLLLRISGRKFIWPIRDLMIRPWSLSSQKPPFMLMSVLKKSELVLPIPSSAELSDTSPTEFIQEFERRRTECRRRRNRYRSYRFWRMILRRAGGR